MSATAAAAGAMAAASGANAAAAAAHLAARRAECRPFVAGYRHDGNIQHARAYSECVGLLYPEPLSPGVGKPIAGFILLALVAGIVIGCMREDELVGKVLVGFLAWICILGSGLLLAGVVACAVYLFS